MLKKIIIILLTYISSIYCQINIDAFDWVIVDSVIFETKQHSLPYLFDNLIDSARSAISKEARRHYDEGAINFQTPYEKPLLFGIKKGKVISYSDYLNESKSIFPDSCYMQFVLDIDWQGNISKAKLKMYKGKIDLKWDLDYFLSNLKAIPSKYTGIPLNNTKWNLPIRKR